MKKTLTLAILSALALLPLQAVQEVIGFEQAAQVVTDDGYAVFVYGEGWDKKGKATCEKLVKDPAIRKALGNAVVLMIPYYNAPTDEQKEQVKLLMERTVKQNGKDVTEKIDYPGGQQSYPMIALYNKQRFEAVHLRGDQLYKGKGTKVDPAKIAATLAPLHEGVIKQSQLLEAASKAQGKEKAKLLFEASRIPGLNRPKEANKKAILELDKDDSQGYGFAIEYYNGNVGKLGEKGPDGKPLTTDSYLALLDKNLANPLLTTEQKQNTCAFAIGTVHRAYGKGGTKLIRKYAEQMKALDPNSKLGISADTVIRDWTADGLVYTMGWNADTVPMDTDPIELFGKLGITQGTCTVTFKHTGGRNRATIKGVALFDGKTKIAEDGHSTTVNNTETYTLNVPTAPKEPHLFITFDVKPDARNTQGDIVVEMKK